MDATPVKRAAAPSEFARLLDALPTLDRAAGGPHRSPPPRSDHNHRLRASHEHE